MRHWTEVHNANRLDYGADWRLWHYFACTCGICGPPRASAAKAHADALAHRECAGSAP